MPMELAELETPVPVVDLPRLHANLERAATYAQSQGLALRPHVKTHKSPWIAEAQRRLGAVGVTCATPREAEVMAGVGDVLVAYPPVSAPRALRLASLPEQVELTVALDSQEAVAQLARAVGVAGRRARVYVEMDLGMHRVGVAGVQDAIALARSILSLEQLEYAGIAFYPGHVRAPMREQDAALTSLDEQLVEIVESMALAGVRPGVVSGGSTPTLWRSHELREVTEIRPGTYVYNDRTTAAIGACEWEECALTVLSTVVSTSVPGQAVIDAGTKALGREPLRGADNGGDDPGFGALLDRPEVTVRAMSEEHGILDLARTAWRPKVGDQVRVVPNHVCIVVHLFDRAVGLRDGVVEHEWEIAARGR